MAEEKVQQSEQAQQEATPAMLHSILGQKLGMTQMFLPTGVSVAVTLINIGDCFVAQIKNQEKDGYNAIQVGRGEKKKSRQNKAEIGHFAETKQPVAQFLREFLCENPAVFTLGQKLTTDFLKPGDKVEISGLSKGKGFAGGIKRWGFHGGPAAHGSRFHRAPGSIGCHTYPARVWKGRRMPGHLGAERVTILNLEVVQVDHDNGLLVVKGAIPGGKRGLVEIKKSVRV